MRAAKQPLWGWLTILLLAAGCTMVKPPLEREPGYPADWPEISTLGTECKGLDGSYVNEGTVVDGAGNAQAILLTSCLLNRSPAGVDSVELKVVTRKGKPEKDTVARLHVSLGEQKTNRVELGDCFCVKHALLLPAVSQSSGAVPGLAVGGSQQNVWLTKAADGSLIAKVWDYNAGIVVVVPFYSRSYVWARFKAVVASGER